MNFGAGFIRHPIAPLFLGLAEAQAPHQSCHCRIPDPDAFFFRQFFIHPLNPAVALLV